MGSTLGVQRTRGDRCPGVSRPWPADDGLLVRLRLAGGRLKPAALLSLLELVEAHGDGRVYLTSRANLQIRGLVSDPDHEAALPTTLIDQIEAAGFLPSRTHELVRNVMVTPDTGLVGSRGRADLRGVAAHLDTLLCADPLMAQLPGRFLFVLDDGTGDLREIDADLGVVALDPAHGQLRIGHGFGDIIPLDQAPSRLVGLAREFVTLRGGGEQAAWHVRELADALTQLQPADDRLPEAAPALPFGTHPAGQHVEVGQQGFTRAAAHSWGLLPGSGRATELVATPWYGIVKIEGHR